MFLCDFKSDSNGIRTNRISLLNVINKTPRDGSCFAFGFCITARERNGSNELDRQTHQTPPLGNPRREEHGHNTNQNTVCLAAPFRAVYNTSRRTTCFSSAADDGMNRVKRPNSVNSLPERIRNAPGGFSSKNQLNRLRQRRRRLFARNPP